MRVARRAKHEVLRAELQEAAQARGAGVKLGANGGASALSGDAWLEEVRLGRRRRTVAGTALAALEVRFAPRGAQAGVCCGCFGIWIGSSSLCHQARSACRTVKLCCQHVQHRCERQGFGGAQTGDLPCKSSS